MTIRNIEKSTILLARVTTFAAAVAHRSSAPEPARAFVAFVSRPAFKAKFAESGLDYRQE